MTAGGSALQPGAPTARALPTSALLGPDVGGSALTPNPTSRSGPSRLDGEKRQILTPEPRSQPVGSKVHVTMVAALVFVWKTRGRCILRPSASDGEKLPTRSRRARSQFVMFARSRRKDRRVGRECGAALQSVFTLSDGYLSDAHLG